MESLRELFCYMFYHLFVSSVSVLYTLIVRSHGPNNKKKAIDIELLVTLNS